MRFDGRRVLVAGSAGGIGAASAAAFRDDGAAVARGTRDADGLARFAAAHGGTDIHAVTGDLAMRRAVAGW